MKLRNVSWAVNQHIRMISERSCDTEDWSNDAENSDLITGINCILKCIPIEFFFFFKLYKYFTLLPFSCFFFCLFCDFENETSFKNIKGLVHPKNEN